MKKLLITLLVAAIATFAFAQTFTCSKRTCSQMDSCEEARFHLTQCGVSSLDREKDGMPCESLCGGKKK
ncbi:excalibur calcium-binding domain-containing protein [Glaesserella parasuis]|nr:excalibur calcium-binding domain-containing protein [Glaesserella parasuis]